MQFREDMPDWLWIEAPESWPLAGEAMVVDQPLDAIVVFASKSRETRALEACRRICEEDAMAGCSLLVAGTRYQMTIAHEVRRLPRGQFVFTPIDEETLLNGMSRDVNAGPW
jgi:hypothetical protein